MKIETHSSESKKMPGHVNTKESSLKILLEDKDGNPKTGEQVISFINKYAPFFSGVEPGKFNQMRSNLVDAIQRWSDLEQDDGKRTAKLEKALDHLREKIPSLESDNNSFYADDGSEYILDDNGDYVLVS